MARKSKADMRAEASLIATAAHGLPVVVLVGRANVGKSTLFNRIVRRGRAIVSPIAGTTRDLNMARAAHEGREFVVIDSGGLGTLVSLFTSARNAGGAVKLASLSQRVGDLLQITKLFTIFEVFDDEQKAAQSFKCES